MEKEFIKFEKLIFKLIESREKALRENHDKLYEELKEELERIYDSYEIDGQLTFDEMAKYDRLKKLSDFVIEKVKETYQVNRAVTRKLLTDIVNITRINTQDLILRQVESKNKVNFIEKKYDVAKTVNNRMGGLTWIERLGKHRGDTIYSIQQAIKQGLDNGETYSQMAKNISKQIGISYDHAKAIARTEGARCMSQTRTNELDELQRQGIIMTKRWVNSQDERVRPQHVTMGTRDPIPYEDDFILPDGTRTKAPVQTGKAEHDIRCRCIIVIKVIGVRK